MVLAAPVSFQRSASRTLLSNPGGLHQWQVVGREVALERLGADPERDRRAGDRRVGGQRIGELGRPDRRASTSGAAAAPRLRRHGLRARRRGRGRDQRQQQRDPGRSSGHVQPDRRLTFGARAPPRAAAVRPRPARPASRSATPPRARPPRRVAAAGRDVPALGQRPAPAARAGGVVARGPDVTMPPLPLRVLPAGPEDREAAAAARARRRAGVRRRDRRARAHHALLTARAGDAVAAVLARAGDADLAGGQVLLSQPVSTQTPLVMLHVVPALQRAALVVAQRLAGAVLADAIRRAGDAVARGDAVRRAGRSARAGT